MPCVLVPTMSKKVFLNGMEKLRAQYGAYSGDAAMWQLKVDSYWDALKNFETEVLTKALNRAHEPDYYPDKFPTAGQLSRIARDIKRERAVEEETTERGGWTLADWDGTMEQLREMYPDTDFQERELPPGHPANTLAMQWVQEDRKRTGWEPGCGQRPPNTPADIAKPRFAKILEMLGDKGMGEVPF